jgi:hypothetical protein
MSSRITIQILTLVLSYLKTIISLIELILESHSSNSISSDEIINSSDQTIIDIPNDSDSSSSISWILSSSSSHDYYINHISSHRGIHSCCHYPHCINARFFCGSGYYNEFGSLTECGWMSFDDDWSHPCRGQGFLLGVDPQNISLDSMSHDTDSESVFSSAPRTWDEFSYSS